MTRLGDDVIEAFQRAEVGLSLVPSARRRVGRVHGHARRGRATKWSACASGPGSRPMHVVAPQAEPDPDFPTVAFPNPEEPGALDLSLAEAAGVGADVLIANDPDADRLGAAIPDRRRRLARAARRRDRRAARRPRAAAHVGFRSPGRDDASCRRRCSSKMAAAAGVQYAETLTGFKWIVRAASDRPDSDSCSATRRRSATWSATSSRDKDGITAAMILAEVAALAKAEGVSLQDRLDALARAHGLHATDQSVGTARRRRRRGPDRVGDGCVAPRSPGRASRARGAAARGHRHAPHRRRPRRGAPERHRAQAQDLLRGRGPGGRDRSTTARGRARGRLATWSLAAAADLARRATACRREVSRGRRGGRRRRRGRGRCTRARSGGRRSPP